MIRLGHLITTGMRTSGAAQLEDHVELGRAGGERRLEVSASKSASSGWKAVRMKKRSPWRSSKDCCSVM